MLLVLPKHLLVLVDSFFVYRIWHLFDDPCIVLMITDKLHLQFLLHLDLSSQNISYIVLPPRVIAEVLLHLTRETLR